MIIIGSRALYSKFENESSIERLSKADFDVIMSFDDFNFFIEKFDKKIIEMVPNSHNKYNLKIMINDKKVQYEIEINSNDSSGEFLLNNINVVTDANYTDQLNVEWRCLSFPYLMLMKKSHLYFPVHFEKNINDYHFLKSILGDIELNENMETFFNLRKKESYIKFEDKYSTPSLEVSNEEFFSVSGKANGRVYIHDDLHEVVKHFNKPIYNMLKYEEKKDRAWCEKDLFHNLPYDYRIKCVQEEAYVIALERYILPQFGEYKDFFWCYKRALRRICTTLCSGFFRQFAFENYPIIVNAYNEDFYNKFLYAKNNNLIKPMDFS